MSLESSRVTGLRFAVEDPRAVNETITEQIAGLGAPPKPTNRMLLVHLLWHQYSGLHHLRVPRLLTQMLGWASLVLQARHPGQVTLKHSWRHLPNTSLTGSLWMRSDIT